MVSYVSMNVLFREGEKNYNHKNPNKFYAILFNLFANGLRSGFHESQVYMNLNLDPPDYFSGVKANFEPEFYYQ